MIKSPFMQVAQKHEILQESLFLGTGGPNKTDEFLEKFQEGGGGHRHEICQKIGEIYTAGINFTPPPAVKP